MFREPFGTGKYNFGYLPDPPEYPEFEECPYNVDFEETDECIGCYWYETCKEIEGYNK